MEEAKLSYFLESTAFPDDISYCASESCSRSDCARHLCNIKKMANKTSFFYSVADFGAICTDYSRGGSL